MTTIVFDGALLASDSLLVEDDAADIGPDGPKFYLRDGLLFAWAGAETWHERLADWVVSKKSRKGRLPYPQDHEARASVAVWDGNAWRRYHSELEGCEQPRGPWVLGSGAPFALSALVMGADAVDAVRVASRLDIHTGGHIFACDLQSVKLNATELIAVRHDPGGYIADKTGRKAGEYQQGRLGRGIDVFPLQDRRNSLQLRKRAKSSRRV